MQAEIFSVFKMIEINAIVKIDYCVVNYEKVIVADRKSTMSLTHVEGKLSAIVVHATRVHQREYIAAWAILKTFFRRQWTNA